MYRIVDCRSGDRLVNQVIALQSSLPHNSRLFQYITVAQSPFHETSNPASKAIQSKSNLPTSTSPPHQHTTGVDILKNMESTTGSSGDKEGREEGSCGIMDSPHFIVGGGLQSE